MVARYLFDEIIVDNFAGGGGASTGIEMATGRSVDIAINHDPDAIAMHKTNHPDTEHFLESVWDVDPVKAVKGRPVGLCWLSPDCTHFSKAKGGKPVKKSIRGLAWVAVKWAATVKPRVIMLENVEEFKSWGPLKRLPNGEYVPDPKKRGITFQSFVSTLKRYGYEVQYKELVASHYGAPTTRKRLFMIARCDGQKIVWPKQTHSDTSSAEVKNGKLLPWRTAVDCIDWSLPCPSIFTRKKPLVENTLKRIAKGIQKFIIESNEPYIIKDKNVFRAQFNSGFVSSHIIKLRGTNLGHAITTPLHTITAGGTHFGEVRVFLIKYYGTAVGQACTEPLHTITTKERLGIVTVAGNQYQIVDIGMRMLQPHELFKAQGFPNDYIIDKDCTGKKYPKTKQIARCGNAVPPPFAEALVRANLPELCINSEQRVA